MKYNISLKVPVQIFVFTGREKWLKKSFMA